jgi:hypothetical protein
LNDNLDNAVYHHRNTDLRNRFHARKYDILTLKIIECRFSIYYIRIASVVFAIGDQLLSTGLIEEPMSPDRISRYLRYQGEGVFLTATIT